jgi:threonine dehydrogenase-like Zn-dependent dehydrogenase
MYGGHIAHAVTNTVHPIPAGVEAMDAVMAKLAAIAYHGARVARTTPGDVVAVVGLGPIGQLAQRAHHLHGARVVGFDLSGERVAVARAAGFEAVEIRGDLAETAREVTPAGFDVVVDATGVPAVLRQAIELLRDRGWNEPVETGARLVVQGSYAGDLAVNYQEFFMKGASLVVPRDHQAVDLRLVLGLLARKRLAVRDLVSEVASPELAGDVFRRLGARAGSQMTAVFSWE